MILGFRKTSENAKEPTFGSAEASCFDLYVDEDTTLEPFVGKLVKTGIAFNIPKGFVVEIFLRSSMCKKGILASTGQVDSDYTGEVRIQATNITREPIFLKRGDRIGQARMSKILDYKLEETTEIKETERGSNGFGSSGK